MPKKLDKFTPAKSSKDRFSLIFCQTHDHNQLKMAAKQLSVVVKERKEGLLKKINEMNGNLILHFLLQ